MGWSPGQPGLVSDNPAPSRGLKLEGLKGHFQSNHRFYDSLSPLAWGACTCPPAGCLQDAAASRAAVGLETVKGSTYTHSRAELKPVDRHHPGLGVQAQAVAFMNRLVLSL